MQKVFKQILEGNFDYENGSLDFSCTKVEITLKKDQDYEGSFHIYGPEERYTSGYITSSDLRMECLTREFVGCEEDVRFIFHGENLEEGEVVKGNFFIISNQGEYYIPFVVSVEYETLESSVGPIKNLFHFANLAKSNWREALNLFYNPRFSVVFAGNDSQYYDDYRALSVIPGSEQNMEEFLIRINKKHKVDYLLQEEHLSVDVTAYSGNGGVIERPLTVIRNGWGFTRLYVECEGDFLFTEKEVMTDDDFIGNHYELPVFIDTSMCGQGRKFGRIYLYNAYVSLVVDVTVNNNEIEGIRSREISRKRSTVQLMELYLAFRTRKISTATWLKETTKIVDKQISINENDVVARLFQAQMLITEDRLNEAGWILDHISDILENEDEPDDTLVAYYLYLTTLIHRDISYVNQVTADVEQIYHKDNSNWRVAWLLLYLSEEYHKSVTGRWILLEKQFSIGCSSPVLYIEAVNMLNSNPVLLRKLGTFEKQVLWYGVRQEIIRAEVVEQLIYLAEKEREFSGVLFATLCNLYNKKNDVRLLRQICGLLIKGGKTEHKYFHWYQAGVENQLRITNLYEYYMMSISEDEKTDIHKVVLMYFSYKTNLDYEKAAYLYSYVLKNRQKYPEIYETYKTQIELFCMEQISKLHVNRALCDIYNNVLSPEMFTEETAPLLSVILFANQLKVETPGIRNAYVYYPGMLTARAYPVIDGKAWIPVYGNKYTIVFEDAWNNRFIKNVEYTIEKLMIPGKFVRFLLPFETDNPEFELYLCSGMNEGEGITGENIDRTLKLMDADYVDGSLKRGMILPILQYYYDADEMDALDLFASHISPEELSASEREVVIRFLVLRKNMEEAFRWLKNYGPYFVDPKILARLISYLIEQGREDESDLLLVSAIHVFQKGKHNSVILQYLCDHFAGLTRDMRDLWKASEAYDVDRFGLSERILVQMLYSGVFVGEKMAIFCHYLTGEYKKEIKRAFIYQCATEFFVKYSITDELIFLNILEMEENGEEVKKGCKLALLKYYAENQQSMTPPIEKVVKKYLEEFMNDGIRMDFFRQYRNYPRVRQELDDKIIIEYHVGMQKKACIHYVILHENGDSDEYISEYMKEVYGGVCVKEFILFFGETLQYYITEESPEESRLTESGNLQKSDIVDEERDSRYSLINDIVISRSLEDYETMENLMEEYHKKVFLNSRLFVLK